MRFATFLENDSPRAALILSYGLVAVDELLPERAPFEDLLDVIAAHAEGAFETVTPENTPEEIVRPIADVVLLPPVLSPPKIIALGLNYKGHAEEQGKGAPEHPLLFAKARTAICGPQDDIVIPPGITQLDYEVELCVVIGALTDEPVDVKNAMDAVFGFTIMNDVSAREAQFGDKQWYRGKSYRTFAPTGPVVVTKDELDWRSIKIETRVNGKVMQSATTAELIHGVPEIVSYISRVHPLEPGDLIATGTPAGVGVFRKPPVFLKNGDLVECTIDGIGTIRNKVVNRKNKK
jgi:2-keto-4-pentenoate hydratase/2-oxohepta-3-ene-1,7-dioic acid hydratase in catechol pathway